jgi:hypothetical protein
MVESVASCPHQPLPPEWREEFLANLPELQRYCEEMRAWQRTSDDPFERGDVALWSQVTPYQAHRVFNSVVDTFSSFDGEIAKLYLEATEWCRIVGAPPITETEFRKSLARVLAQHAILKIIPAREA